MKNCATCRFRGAEKEDWDDAAGKLAGTGLYPCVAIIHGNRHSDILDAKKNRAMVVDGSGYSAQLLVRLDFGCVLHEERDA